MRKRFLIQLLLFVVLLITGCSSVNKGNSDKESHELSINSSDSLVTTKNKISSQAQEKWDQWNQSVYIDDKLYYVTQRNQDGVKVTEVNSYQAGETEVLIAEMNVMAPSIALTKSEVIYYVLAENADEYKIVDILNDGYRRCHDISDIRVNIIEREGILSAAVTENGYCVMTISGTLLMWDNAWNEIAPVYPDWQNDILYDESIYEYGLINGKLGIYAYLKKNDDIHIQLIDWSGEKLGNVVQIPMPEEASNVSSTVLCSGFDEGIYILTGEYLLNYNDENNKCKEVMCLAELNMKNNLEYVDAVSVNENGKIYFAGYDHEKKEGVIFNIEEKDSDSIKSNTVVLGYIYDASKSSLENYVENFNIEQSEVDIIFKKYDNFLDLQIDIIQGKGPDILSLFRADINEYVDKGILENLNPYFNESKNISIEDILPAMRTLMTRNEGIRFVYPWFTLEILLLEESIASANGITTAEFLKLSKESDDEYLCHYSPGSLLYRLFPLEQAKYINWEERNCSFTSEDFVLFLKSLKQADLPEKDPYTELTYAEQMEQGKYLALFSYLKCLQDYGEIKDAFGSSVKISSYPNWQGEEAYPINIGAGCLAINSASEQKDDAWKFLEYYLLDYAENVNLQGGYFSVLNETLNKQIDPANIKKNSMYDNFYNGVENIEIRKEYTESEIAQIVNMVDNAVWSDPILTGEIGKIIMEEAAYYLKGDKTAEEVADIIQSRVSIYMEE